MARVILGQGNFQGKDRQGHRQSICMVSINLSKERNKWIPDRFPSIFWREINFRTSGATGSTDRFCLKVTLYRLIELREIVQKLRAPNLWGLAGFIKFCYNKDV